MSEFKIESVPLPDDPAPQPKRRGRPPGSKNKPKVKIGAHEHVWTPLGVSGSGVETEECLVCHDVFPCVGDCTHVDCKEAKGLELPEWYLENLAANRFPVRSDAAQEIQEVQKERSEEI